MIDLVMQTLHVFQQFKGPNSNTVRKIKIKNNPTVQFCKTMFILAFVGYMEKYWWRRLTEGNCLFCGVFNDAASSSNFIVPYDRMINE
jgi:hypothetical protein